MAARRFLSDGRAAVTVEYVVLFLPLIALVFIAFQIALAYHFALTAQKAVELGARIAAVRDPVRADLPRINEVDPDPGCMVEVEIDGEIAAQPCARGHPCGLGACLDPGGPWICRGADPDGACDPTAFAAIVSEVGRIAYLLDPEEVTVAYRYVRLGFAGGPFTPIVEVSIAERPFFLQFFFNLAFGSGDDAAELRLPAAAASAIAEDLSSSG